MAVVEGGAGCNLITGYAAGEDTNQDYGSNRWLAQTFILTKAMIVWRCRFKSWRWLSSNYYEYAIRATDATGKPLSPDLAVTGLSATGEADSPPGKWRRFDFLTTNLLPPGTYALLARVPGSVSVSSHKMRCDTTTPTFTDGKAWLSNDSGITWTEIAGTDLMFEIWGWEPPPVGDPEPVISNWAPMDVVYYPDDTAIYIQVTTDIPVHLFMRWTLIEPKTHATELVRRGISLPYATRWCFVVWEENEQLEAGDTYIHTFYKPNWPVCQTRWFYFIGTKQAEESPSASPIFKLHHKEVEIMGCYFARAAIKTAWYSQKNASWTVARLAPTGDVYSVTARIYCRSRVITGPLFELTRIALRWDTSIIPVGSTIHCAAIHLFPYSKTDTGDPKLYVVAAVGCDWNALAADYGYLLNNVQPISDIIDFGDLPLGAWKDIPLNLAGRQAINPGGTTVLGLRTSFDVLNIQPIAGTKAAAIEFGGGSDVSTPPILNLCWSPP